MPELPARRQIGNDKSARHRRRQFNDMGVMRQLGPLANLAVPSCESTSALLHAMTPLAGMCKGFGRTSLLCLWSPSRPISDIFQRAIRVNGELPVLCAGERVIQTQDVDVLTSLLRRLRTTDHRQQLCIIGLA